MSFVIKIIKVLEIIFTIVKTRIVMRNEDKSF